MKKKFLSLALALMLFRFSASVPGYSAAVNAAKNAGSSWAQEHITVKYDGEKYITVVK